jgi:hypothetical protein
MKLFLKFQLHKGMVQGLLGVYFFLNTWVAGGHAAHFSALEPVKDGIRPCHSYCRTALYTEIPSERKSESSRNSFRLNAQYGEGAMTHAKCIRLEQ